MRAVWIGLAGLIAAALMPAARALAATDPATQIYDPWEHANRALYRFNDGLDRAVLRPAAMGYKRVLPQPVRSGVHNVLNNLDTPNTLVNDLLQGRVMLGGQSAARFVINSTAGIAGIFDVASPLGIPGHDADFGQTLGRWGLPPGPFIFVPVFGPSDLRDGTGRMVDGVASVLSLHDLHVTTPYRIGDEVLVGLDARVALDSTLEDVSRTATDPYATERSAYLQHRHSMVVDSRQAVDQLPSFDEPPPASAPPAATKSGPS